MQQTQAVLTAVKFLLCCMKGGERGFKESARGWVRIVYHLTAFNNATCTSMAYRAENYHRSLVSLFTIHP